MTMYTFKLQLSNGDVLELQNENNSQTSAMSQVLSLYPENVVHPSGYTEVIEVCSITVENDSTTQETIMLLDKQRGIVETVKSVTIEDNVPANKKVMRIVSVQENETKLRYVVLVGDYVYFHTTVLQKAIVNLKQAVKSFTMF